jgi:DMSO reductase anchor subunit
MNTLTTILAQICLFILLALTTANTWLFASISALFLMIGHLINRPLFFVMKVINGTR